MRRLGPLLAVAAAAALLFGWHLAGSDFVPYYSAAARSMSESWPAFLFGSLDPAGSISLDKIPGFLWPQALSARIFGFSAWALTLPQVIEGVVGVVVLGRAVRRWAGPAAGLLAAGIFAFTPVVASMFGHALEDAALTMCLVLAAHAWQRAVDGARLRWLLLAGLWVGLGFQAKMLVAWVVLPAFALAYLVAAPASLRRRLAHLGLAGLVAAAVSASWMLIVALTPAADRPFVDGTTNDSVFAMVLGYNGVTRFGAPGPGGAITPNFGQLPAVATGGAKLLDPHLATQIGWLYPLAAVALGCGLWWRRGEGRSDRLRAGLLMWGLWLGVAAAALSAGTVIHTTYMAVLAPPIAALGGAGIVLFGRTRALPVSVVLTLAWGALLSSRYPSFLPWLAPAAVTLAAAGLALLAAARPRGRLAAVGLVAAVAAMLATPTAWAASTLDPAYDGSALDASAGPSGIFDLVAPNVAAAGRAQAGGAGDRAAAFGFGPPTPEQRTQLTYLEAHQHGARYLVATPSIALATLYIRDSGMPVLLLGGFTGLAPHPTLDQFRALVASGQVRYALEPDPPSGTRPATARDAIAVWVRANCRSADAPAAGDRLYIC